MDRREAVAELVRDTRGELADLRQAVLQPQLLLELDDVGEVAEQADRAVRAPGSSADRRDRDAEVRRGRSLGSMRAARPHDRLAGVEALLDHARERRGAEQHVVAVAAPVRVRHAEEPPAGGIERLDAPSSPTTSRPDVRLAMISLLSRSEASARAAIACSCALQLADRFLHRRRHERGLGAASPRATRLSRRGEQAQHGKGQRRDERSAMMPSARAAE